MRSVEELLPTHPFRADAYLQAMQEHHVRTQGEVAFEKTLEAYEAYLEGEQRVNAVNLSDPNSIWDKKED
ncbi:hypothetical protein [Alicyclobacillus sp. SP_1]|uniref:hypothetical protein n=1 Tax=Alicyclobacillus sp. SP_1 TaxID=2942475 RepID=UPI00215836CB|nr:hypothetical protein [Alicyclobacillus sp. SP_1]